MTTATPESVLILQVPDCPLVEQLRDLVNDCLAALSDPRNVETTVGDYPSPTLIIGGLDVATGRPVDDRTCCRLDLPSRDQVLVALRQSGTS